MTRDFATTALTPELICTDIKVSLAFYTEVLGFKIQYQREEAGFAMLEHQGARIMLDQYEPGNPRTWIAGPLAAPFGRGMNLQIETEAVDALYAGVQQAGVAIFLPMEEKWYRANACYVGNRQFIVQDPDGYLLRFFQDMGTRTEVS
jgi:catechol 2,3-dioxygenase-like lactoylglutathione lyase family enzyme